MAGNTTLFDLANEGTLEDVNRLIDISGLGLSFVRKDDTGEMISIGATTTFAEVSNSPLLRSEPSLSGLLEVSEKITPPQIRNMGTIGGSICSGISFYDMPVALLALGGELRAVSLDGERAINIDDFFVDTFATAIAPNELLTEIRVPIVERTGSSFVKLGRASVDFAVVSAAASLTVNRNLQVVQARVSLGSVAATPIRAKETENSI